MNLFWKVVIVVSVISGVWLLVTLWFTKLATLRRVDEIHERLDELEHVKLYRRFTPQEQDEWRGLSRELAELT